MRKARKKGPNTMTRNRYSDRIVMASVLALIGMTLGCKGPIEPGDKGPIEPRESTTPVVAAIIPNMGFTGGNTSVKITGVGFQRGATVTLGGITVQAGFDHDLATIYLKTPAHASGLVDVVVTNPDGKSGVLTGAYTYASPEFVDFNGTWEGGAQTGHVTFRFTIQNNTLTTVSCDTSGTLTLSPPPSVNNGEFSLSRDDGVAISGKFVSPLEAIGTINLAPCAGSDWFATKADPRTE
jgi:hypothetical protein